MTVSAVRSEFEMDMEYELDQLITDYANEHLSGNRKKKDVKAVSAAEVGDLTWFLHLWVILQ